MCAGRHNNLNSTVCQRKGAAIPSFVIVSRISRISCGSVPQDNATALEASDETARMRFMDRLTLDHAYGMLRHICNLSAPRHTCVGAYCESPLRFVQGMSHPKKYVVLQELTETVTDNCHRNYASQPQLRRDGRLLHDSLITIGLISREKGRPLRLHSLL